MIVWTEPIRGTVPGVGYRDLVCTDCYDGQIEIYRSESTGRVRVYCGPCSGSSQSLDEVPFVEDVTT